MAYRRRKKNKMMGFLFLAVMVILGAKFSEQVKGLLVKVPIIGGLVGEPDPSKTKPKVKPAISEA